MSSQITFNLAQGAVRFNFSVAAAQSLKTALGELMTQLKLVSASAGEGARRTPTPPVEYQHTGDVFLEVFCNPNIWPSPFAAKVLMTLRDDRLRITLETELSQLYDDVNAFLEQA
ncbi:MAG: hypothetical protein ACFCVD_07630 [Nodosilinea sp.]